ncbi:phage tail tip lysozyme [uncultured Vagococcus sp.]|uniref:phage tail tip lysozyme n=1 Tax=uncultured Vagococcus sp. TaxID=189676 RepID=UPI0028D21EC9|nr:phage tail tip lysozyme [uncultured Vagococcus sp.]
MIVLYEKNEKEFTHNGLGVLDNAIYDDNVSWTDNGLFVFTFRYPLFAKHGAKIQGERIVKCPTPDGEQAFRIHKPKTTNGIVEVGALHISYDLSDNLIEDTFIVGKNGQQALDQMSRNTQYPHPFTFNSDINLTANSRVVRKNPIAFLIDSSLDNSFVNRWGGHMKRDNFKISMMQHPGKNRGIVIRDKKNLVGYESDLDYEAVITRIMPQGFDGLLLPEKYVDSPIINSYDHPKIEVVEFPDIKARKEGQRLEEGEVELEEAHRLLRLRAAQCYTDHRYDYPKATYSVNFVEISKTVEYEEFQDLETILPGDTVNVIHEEDGFSIESEMIGYEYTPSIEEYKSLRLGNYKGGFTSVMTEVQSVKESITIKSKEIASDLIHSGFGGHVRVYPDKILIMDTFKEETATRVWQWNINGFGYSKNGINGEYGLAMTMKGEIVADFITVGIIRADVFENSFNKTGDTLKLKEGKLSIWNSETRIMELTKKGLEFWRGTESIGTMGTTAKSPSWTPSSGETERAIQIKLINGEFIQIINEDEDGLFIPSKNFGTGSNATRLTLFGAKGLDLISDKAGLSLTDRGVEIMGGLYVGGKEITPGGTGGGGWNGDYPPEVTTQMEKNAWRVWVFFQNKGWNTRAIAGMLGNMESESWINPDQHETSGGGGYGLVQWTPASKLIDWCNANGLDYKTVESQCMRIQYEVDNNLQWFANPQRPDLEYISFSTFTYLADEKIAAEYFIAFYEHPANPNQPIRAQQATAWYNKFKDLVQPGGKYGYPVLEGTPVSSWFGPRWGTMHNGIDFAGVIGDPIFAAQSGTVVYSYFDPDMGEWVVIKHDNDAYMTGYAHNSARLVNVGDKVSKGQQIARMGSTGDSTGPHLHFAVQTEKWGGYKDPAPFLGLTPP